MASLKTNDYEGLVVDFGYQENCEAPAASRGPEGMMAHLFRLVDVLESHGPLLSEAAFLNDSN